MTWADFMRSLEAWVHNQNQDWDRARYISTIYLNGNPFSKKSIKPKELFRLPHDNIGRNKIELPSKEEMKEVYERKLVFPSK